MASMEAAMSTVARPRLTTRIWHWRYEFGLIAGTVLGMIGIGVTLGPGWLIAATAAAMAILRAACWASDVRVVVNDRRSHIVVLEVIRRPPPSSPEGGGSGWPYLDRDEAGSPEPEEPALYYGLGLPRPLG
jgi:hypothetical protein